MSIPSLSEPVNRIRATVTELSNQVKLMMCSDNKSDKYLKSFNGPVVRVEQKHSKSGELRKQRENSHK